MKKFERVKPDSDYYIWDIIEDTNEFEDIDIDVRDICEQLIGTPFHGSPPWDEFISDVRGYEPNADAYVYVIVLKRQHDETRWYYVGEVEGERLKTRLRSHVRNFDNQRVIARDGYEVLAGDHNHGIRPEGEGFYFATGIERLVSLFQEEIGEVDEDSWRGYVLEQERRMAFEVATAYETTNVLGGK